MDRNGGGYIFQGNRLSDRSMSCGPPETQVYGSNPLCVFYEDKGTVLVSSENEDKRTVPLSSGGAAGWRR